MMSLLRILPLFPALIILTQSLRAQDCDTITCLSNRKLDYLISEQSNATFLRKDTTLKADKIKDLWRTVNKQADVLSKTDAINRLNKDEIRDLNKSFDDMYARFVKSDKWRKRWRSATGIFVSITIILIGVFALSK